MHFNLQTVSQTTDTFVLGEAWKIGRCGGPNRDRIRYATLAPRQAPVTAAPWILFMGGRTEWIEKYDYVAEDLSQAGFNVLAIDHRGQGISQGKRGHIVSYREYAEDVAEVLRVVLPKGASYGVLGHSMGGLIALYAMIKGCIKPQALVMSSPLLGMPDKPVPILVAKPLTKWLSRLGLGGLGSGAAAFDGQSFAQNILTHDPAKFARLALRPYPVPSPTFSWVNATFAALNDVFAPSAVENLKTPILLLQAQEELVVDARAAKDWAAKVKSFAGSDIQYQEIPGAFHEILSETPEIYGNVIQQMKTFFLGRLKNLAS
jgi:lysophospholipase